MKGLVRKRRPRRGGMFRGLDSNMQEKLETGNCIFEPLFTDEEIRAAWSQYGDELLIDWISAQPGTRPWAWWMFEAPEQRRVVGGDEALIFSWDGWRDYFGRPKAYTNDPERVDDPPRFETAREYLVRHNLLTAGERKR